MLAYRNEDKYRRIKPVFFQRMIQTSNQVFMLTLEEEEGKITPPLLDTDTKKLTNQNPSKNKHPKTPR